MVFKAFLFTTFVILIIEKTNATLLSQEIKDAGGNLEAVTVKLGDNPILITIAEAMKKNDGESIQVCDLDDYACMGIVLAFVSTCNPCVFGGIPNNYTIFNFHYETNLFSASAIARYQIFQNVDKCKVSAFYYNYKRNILLYALTCKNLKFISTIRITPHVPEELDQNYNFDFTLEGDVIFTSNMKNVLQQNLDYCDSFTSAEFEKKAVINIVPKDAAAKQYLAKNSLKLLTTQSILTKELIQWLAPPAAFTFTNGVICNFGCFMDR